MNQRVMTSRPVVLRILITELPTLVEQKSKQTAYLKPNYCPSTFYYMLKRGETVSDLDHYFEDLTKLKICSEDYPTFTFLKPLSKTSFSSIVMSVSFSVFPKKANDNGWFSTA